MEVYAGFQENADYEVGRVVEAIEEMGQADNTLIIYIWGDNGSSMEGTETGTFNELTTITGIPLTAEQQLKLIDAYGGIDAWGGPVMQPHFACAWAWAGNTPFQWGKQVASHFGGTRNPMVVSWPGRIKDRGGLRSQFTHVHRRRPDHPGSGRHPRSPSRSTGSSRCRCTGRASPTRSTTPAPRNATPSSTSRSSATAPCTRTAGSPAPAWTGSRGRLDPKTLEKFAPGRWDPDKDKWELYNLEEDFSQANDLAAKHPEKLRELQDLFWQDAEKYHVTPLLAGFAQFFGVTPPSTPRTRFTYYPGTENIGAGMIPHIYNRSFTITADLDIPAAGAEGVIVAESDVMGGFSLYVQDGKLHYTYSFLGIKVDTLTASENLPSGKVQVRYEFVADQLHPCFRPGLSILAYVWGGRAPRAVAARSDSAIFPGFASARQLVRQDGGVTAPRAGQPFFRGHEFDLLESGSIETGSVYKRCVK